MNSKVATDKNRRLNSFKLYPLCSKIVDQMSGISGFIIVSYEEKNILWAVRSKKYSSWQPAKPVDQTLFSGEFVFLLLTFIAQMVQSQRCRATSKRALDYQPDTRMWVVYAISALQIACRYIGIPPGKRCVVGPIGLTPGVKFHWYTVPLFVIDVLPEFQLSRLRNVRINTEPGL